MRKKIARNLAIINCLLLTLPGLASAEESAAESADVYTLDEVVVTAVPLDKYLVTTSVITAKEIEEKGAQNLSQVLEEVPGVHMHYGQKKGSNSIDIRGMSMSYTKVYVDGVLVNPLGKMAGGEVDMNMFPVDNIAKIEVVKGPAPVSYGVDAVGGIILITTKNGYAAPGGKVSLSGGSDSTRNASISYGSGDNKFNYHVNAGTEHTDGFRDNGDRKTNYFNTKLNWKVKDNALLTFAGSYSLTDKGCLNPIDPATGQTVYSTKGWWAGLNNWQYRDWEKTNLSLTYAEKISDTFDYNIKLYRFTEDQGLWADGRLASTAVVTAEQWLQGYVPGTASNDSGYSLTRWNASYWESTLRGVESQGNLKLDTKHTLTFGSLYNDADWRKSVSDNPVSDPYNPDAYHWSNYSNKRYGYYLQDNLIADEKTMITFGIRHDKNEARDFSKSDSKTNSATNPTVNMVYQLDENNTLRVSYGETISFPSVKELYGAYGNADLKPEEAKNYEIGWKHRFDGSLTGDIAIFKNDITNMIDQNLGADGKKYYYNISDAQIKGIELELNKQFTERWNGFVNYAFMDTTGKMTMYDFSTKDNELKNVPDHHINYGLTYKADKGYKYSITGHIVTSMATWDETAFGKSGTTNDTRTPNTKCYSKIDGYHTLDMQVRRDINDAQAWYINIYNIFDEKYESELFAPAPGRTVIVGLDYKF